MFSFDTKTLKVCRVAGNDFLRCRTLYFYAATNTRHSISLEKGKLIKKTNHGRDRSKTIKKYREAMIHLFEDEQSSTFFIHKVVDSHKRYARD